MVGGRSSRWRACRLAAAARIFVETIFRELRRECGARKAECGAVLFVHRAGGSLNANPHLHVLVIDGVLCKTEGAPLDFSPAPPPSGEMLERVVRSVHQRMVRWLRRHGYIDERELEDRSNEAPEETDLQRACEFIDMAINAYPDFKLLEERNKLAVDQHLQVLKKFGRYPQRNAEFGRESTPAERAWLDDKENLPIWAGGRLSFDQAIK